MSSPDLDPQKVWFKDGVQFSCIEGCIRCCGGAPGDVFVTAEEIAAIAAYMKMSREDFENQYVRHYSSGRMSLIEMPNGDCILLDVAAKGCGIYSVRPQQCRDYPFWPEVMHSALSWLKETRRCPGLGDGEHHTAVKIVDLLKTQKE